MAQTGSETWTSQTTTSPSAMSGGVPTTRGQMAAMGHGGSAPVHPVFTAPTSAPTTMESMASQYPMMAAPMMSSMYPMGQQPVGPSGVMPHMQNFMVPMVSWQPMMYPGLNFNANGTNKNGGPLVPIAVNPANPYQTTTWPSLQALQSMQALQHATQMNAANMPNISGPAMTLASMASATHNAQQRQHQHQQQQHHQHQRQQQPQKRGALPPPYSTYTTQQPPQSTLTQSGRQTTRRISYVRKDRVSNACLPCKKAKTRCDDGRPCRRCIRLGREDQCKNSIHRKRGRKRKYFRTPMPPSADGTTHQPRSLAQGAPPPPAPASATAQTQAQVQPPVEDQAKRLKNASVKVETLDVQYRPVETKSTPTTTTQSSVGPTSAAIVSTTTWTSTSKLVSPKSVVGDSKSEFPMSPSTSTVSSTAAAISAPASTSAQAVLSVSEESKLIVPKTDTEETDGHSRGSDSSAVSALSS